MTLPSPGAEDRQCVRMLSQAESQRDVRPLRVVVLAETVVQAPPATRPKPQRANAPPVRELHGTEAEGLVRPQPLGVRGIVVEARAQPHPGRGAFGGMAGHHVDHAAQSAGAVERRSRSLHHLDPLHLRERDHVPVERPGIARIRRYAVHQEHHPGPGPPGVARGAPDVELLSDELHRGRVRHRAPHILRYPTPNLALLEDRYGDRCVAKTQLPLRGRRHDAAHRHGLGLERDLEPVTAAGVDQHGHPARCIADPLHG